MKKIVLILVAVLSFVACSKEEDNNSNIHNPYDGTTWAESVPGYGYAEDQFRILEFSASRFTLYVADKYYNYKHTLCEGAYTFEDTKIFIDDVKGQGSWSNCYFTGATVSGNRLTLRYRGTSGGGSLVMTKK